MYFEQSGGACGGGAGRLLSVPDGLRRNALISVFPGWDALATGS